MLRHYKPVLITAFLIGAAFIGKTQTAVNTNSNAVSFLKISTDPRAGGMGDAALATSPDVYSARWNMAKLGFADASSGIALSYTPWMRDLTDNMYMAGLTGYHQLNEQHSLSFSLRYFNMGDVGLTDFNGNKLASVNPYEWSADLGYALKLSDKIGLGLGFRYIQSNLGIGSVNETQYKAGNAFAGDISVYFNGLREEGSGFTAGMAISNLGTRIGYQNNAPGKEYLPANFGLGAAYNFQLEEDLALAFTTDLNKSLVAGMEPGEDPEIYYEKTVLENLGESLNGDGWRASFGTELNFRKQFSLRAGYRMGSESDGGANHITAGFGMKYKTTRFDFSYWAPNGKGTGKSPLSNTISVGIGFTFNE
ncbi:type IX secretion system outer membrane channel protein PorV [Flavihumibacter sp. UBA7668]|uniref:type IX secretion system outer membrane channel protein PorV n=1 Tax=Flavihumibacter sp. UBA7668 TaxID=1946542 RepID=UPI0025C267CA|nr:type IX secretion system outer membrane channel protein PorV [Flavihumibacter sp. UBA7668]